MSDETTPSGAEPPIQTSDGSGNAESPTEQPVSSETTSFTAQSTPPATPAKKSGVPRWGFFTLLAVLPALVVGILVFALSGGSEKDSNVAVLDGFVRRFSSAGGTVLPYVGETPPGFPDEFPVYGGAREVASFAVRSGQGTTYIVSFETPDSLGEVYLFYVEQLDLDPWQIQAAVSGIEFTGVQFSRPDSADVQGDLTISHTDLDGQTAITVVFTDISQAASTRPEDEFVLPLTRDLPPDFPSDIPIYTAGSSDTVVIDSFFRRDAGTVSYLISFLTKDADIDVINFYTQEFQQRGWDVVDSPAQPGVFSLMIDFQDFDSEEISGSVRADFFAEDPAFTLVELLVQVSPTRGRGN